MKRLILLRHAKSDWSDPYLGDHDRPLNKRGEKTAAKLGLYFKQEKIRPELVLCSTALRAKETLSRLQKTADTDFPVIYKNALYGAGIDTILGLLRNEGRVHDTLMIVGHNPNIENTIVALTGVDESNLLPLVHEKVPTASLISIDFDIKSFAHVSLNSGALTRFVRPKQELTAALASKMTVT